MVVTMSTSTNEKIPSDSQKPSKRILHFSDGTLEVDDDEEVQETEPSQVPVDPRQLNWVPWVWYQAVTASTKTLEVCDYVGESLASFFGITTPKYQFEINEYHRMKKREEEQRKEDLEIGGWANSTSSETFRYDVAAPEKVQVQNIATARDGVPAGDYHETEKY